MNEKNIIENKKNIPFIQKIIFWLTGLSYPFAVLAIYFLFKDNKKYNQQIIIMKNGAMFEFYLALILLILTIVRSALEYFVNFI